MIGIELPRVEREDRRKAAIAIGPLGVGNPLLREHSKRPPPSHRKAPPEAAARQRGNLEDRLSIARHPVGSERVLRVAKRRNRGGGCVAEEPLLGENRERAIARMSDGPLRG